MVEVVVLTSVIWQTSLETLALTNSGTGKGTLQKQFKSFKNLLSFFPLLSMI